MSNEITKPLYKVLNEQRTQDKIGVDYDHCKAPLSLCTGNFDTGDNWEHIASAWRDEDAKYLCLAFNNLHVLAERLEELIKHYEEGFTAQERKEGIAKAKEALNSIS